MTGFSPLRIGIDGFNLAMARGTGVATYARTLSHCLEQMGHPVDVLYGMDITRYMSPTLREIMFFDRLGQDTLNAEQNSFQRAGGRTAAPIFWERKP